jgi:hypothetical protein
MIGIPPALSDQTGINLATGRTLGTLKEFVIPFYDFATQQHGESFVHGGPDILGRKSTDSAHRPRLYGT